MKTKLRFLRYSVIALGIIAVAWTALTFYVELEGPAKRWRVGNDSEQKVLIVFDPDPFYNLDEKVCMSFAKALAEQDMSVSVMTVKAAENMTISDYDALIFCANTYNWRPDWAITNYIEDNLPEGKPVVAITLGAGSTGWSQQNFENVIEARGGNLLASYSLWLWRPNDESKLEQPNVEVAQEMAYAWGKEIAVRIGGDPRASNE